VSGYTGRSGSRSRFVCTEESRSCCQAFVLFVIRLVVRGRHQLCVPLRLHISVLLYLFRFSRSSACWSPFPSPASEELPVMLALQSEIWGSISFCLPRAYTAHSIRPVVLVLGFVFPLLRSRCASPGSGSDRLFRSQLWVLRIDSISFVLCVNHCREDPGCAIEPPDRKSRGFVV
jgi:hypothetical protein